MRRQGSQNDYETSILFLAQCLEIYYGKKVLVLIDEYDVPLENAFSCGFYNEMITLLRALFESGLKDNTSLGFAAITGCLRVSKESIFSGLNNLSIVSIRSIKYDECFGFKVDEVDNLWNFMFFTGYFRKVREWMEDETIYAELTIPNKEVRYIFNQKIQKWFHDKLKGRDMHSLHNAVIEKDCAVMTEEINDIFEETISYMDQNEYYYHGMMAGLLTGIKGYTIRSNREGG